MRIKRGVQFSTGHAAMGVAFIIIEQCLREVDHSVVLVLTSGIDGHHMINSLHYDGLAYDFRTRDLAKTNQQWWARRCQSQLGPDFQVILEADHLHVEFQPKGDTP